MLTVLFATVNRSDLLRRVLENYTHLDEPDGGWHLVVVDNGSTDGTRHILENYLDRLPLTILEENQPGKSKAINRGLHAVRGDLVVMTDDDIFPSPGWLSAFRTAADNHPAVSLFGGRILPRWEAKPPDWIERSVPTGPVYGLTGEFHVEGPIDPGLIAGGNMAVRREVLTSGHYFNEALGPKGKVYAKGEDTAFCIKLAVDGHRTWCCEGALVEHYIRAQQFDRRWILSCALLSGRSRYRLRNQFYSAHGSTWFNIPRYLFRRALSTGIGLGHATLFGNADDRFRCRWDFHFLIGQILGARDVAKPAESPLTVECAIADSRDM